ncbi:MAG: TonB-dependent receptor [Oceanicaulis sp.]
MTSLLLAGAAALALDAAVQADAPDADPRWVDVIQVTGRPIETGAVRPEDAPALEADAAALAARLPGAALIDNGALSGQLQHRGLFGARVPAAIDGVRLASGGPNLMDPPLHYAPTPLVERIELTRGPAPVSEGPALGAAANVVLKSISYAPSATPEVSGSLTAVARSVDDSYGVGAVAGIATARQRLQILASREEGGDLDTPYGTLDGTGHERLVYGAGYTIRPAKGIEARLDMRRQETGETGNPPFPMDIRFFDTTITRAGVTVERGGWTVDLTARHGRVDHAMNNFTLRPAPAPMQRRETFASAETTGFEAEAAYALADGEIRFGADFEASDHDVTITNPVNPDFFVTPVKDAELARTGAFAEWDGRAGGLELYLGARIDAYEAEARSPLIGPALPMGPRMLAAAYTAADRDWDAVTADALVRVARPVSDTTRLRAALYRKSRAPGYLERFAWLPTPASGGLADGNTYVGDLDLDVETATGFEVGVDCAGARAYVRPTAYVSWIGDYIQGAPAEPVTPGVVDTPLEMVSAMNGDPTPLRFSNVEARLHGFDADFGAALFEALGGAWRVDGVISIVRGERTDIEDNLYRIAPDRLTATLSHERASWSAGLEVRAVAEQDRVSASNSEAKTPGHVVLGLVASADLGARAQVSAGVDNLLDQPYRDHLGGYNRNSGLGVPVGERLPGAGRGGWLRLSAAF